MFSFPHFVLNFTNSDNYLFLFHKARVSRFYIARSYPRIHTVNDSSSADQKISTTGCNNQHYDAYHQLYLFILSIAFATFQSNSYLIVLTRVDVPVSDLFHLDLIQFWKWNSILHGLVKRHIDQSTCEAAFLLVHFSIIFIKKNICTVYIYAYIFVEQQPIIRLPLDK